MKIDLNTPSGRVAQWLDTSHLPGGLHLSIGQPIMECAELLDGALEESPEKTTGMRKLLEAKDCFIRAMIEQERNFKESD